MLRNGLQIRKGKHVKRILMFCSRIPYPLIGGDRIRVYNTAKILSANYGVDLVFISEGRVRQDYIEKLKEVFSEVTFFSYSSLRPKWNALKGLFLSLPLQVHYYYFREIQIWVDKNCGNYHLVFAHHIRMAEYLRDASCPRVIDLHDAISMNYSKAKKNARGLWRAIYSVENRRVLPYEVRTVNGFDRSFIVSDVDRDYLVQHGADPRKIVTIPVAVKDEALNRSYRAGEKDQIAFLGKMDYPPNEDAAIYFARKVFPLLRKRNPQLGFLVIGALPPRSVLELRKIPGVAVTEFVENPYRLVAASKVFVAPMRFGAGTQNKILEAMALRKPVVTTSLGARGIKGEEGKHFLIADEPEEMAEKILDLLDDRRKREYIGYQARHLVEGEYTWGRVGEKFLREIERLI